MKIIILGSTGSIGTQTLEVVDSLNNFSNEPEIEIVGLTGNKNIDLLAKQIIKYKPEAAVVMDKDAASDLTMKIGRTSTKILIGMGGINELVEMEAELVVNALVGNIGLMPTFAAIKSGKNIALANKETLVTAGGLINEELKRYGVRLLPIDSEHSAILQCLAGNEGNKIKHIYLTASGGPFRQRESLANVTLEEALAHPNWSMGKKITVDSATLMNKGLEVIEAKWLFNLEASQIKVVVHPQSIIHSMVEFEDGAVMAQLGCHDMRTPIQYALTYPQRVKNDYPKLDFFEINALSFEKPDTERFKCLALAYDAMEYGGVLPAVMNAANEAAVGLFLNRRLRFLQIAELVEKAMLTYRSLPMHMYSIEGVTEAGKWAYNFICNQV